jgi:hypothetical protein
MVRILPLLLLLAQSQSVFGACARTFALPEGVQLSGTIRSIVAGSFDAGARPDVAAAVGNQVIVLLNEPGGFRVGPITTLSENVFRLLTVDWNHDGRMDLIAVGTSSITTMLSSGDGTFTQTKTSITKDIVSGVTAVALADFNLDGKGDLALGVPRNANGALRVFHGNADGTFAELSPEMALPRRPRGFAAADLTNDGFVDLAIADGANATLLHGKGNGTFQPPAPLLAISSLAILADDFDGDHRADILVGSALSLSTRTGQWLDTSIGSPSGAADLDGDGKVDVLSGSVVYRGKGDGTFTNVSAGAAVAAGHAFADFNLDGLLDVAAGNGTNEVYFRFGLGGARLSGLGSTMASRSLARFLLVGDINEDGRDDVITGAGGDLRFFTSAADGSLVHQGSYEPAAPLIGAALGDFNEDGRLDLLLASLGLLLGRGDGTFANALPIPGNSLGNPGVTGDFNGDGNLDMATSDGQDAVIRRFLGDGKGAFSMETTPIPTEANTLAVADFNRDGRDDLAAVGGFSGSSSPAGATALRLVLSGQPTSILLEEDVLSSAVQAADVDRDGQPDILYLAESTNELVILAGNGNGTFREARRFPVEAGHEYASITVADFTADGLPDILVNRRDAEAVLYSQTASGSFSEKLRLRQGGWYGSSAGDFDGDGHVDLALMGGLGNILFTQLSICDGGPVGPRRKRSVRH